MNRPTVEKEWGVTDVKHPVTKPRIRALEQFSKEDARRPSFVLPPHIPQGDPFVFLPAKLILGINNKKRAFHFFRPCCPRKYPFPLCTSTLAEPLAVEPSLQFGSSSTAVFFKMRVAGVLHIFQFETRQGEDICMALQTHINDIMMKRYSKANFGPKYEQHVASLQKSLEEAQERMQQMQKTEDALKYEKEQIALGAITRDLENTKTELALARAAGAAGGAMAAASMQASPVEDTSRGGAGSGRALKWKSRLAELVEANEKLVVLEKRSGQLLKEKELIDKKMQRIEKIPRDVPISNCLLGVGVKADRGPSQGLRTGRSLGELRELKEDVERKEKQQAMIIENQAKRLEELEKLFKDEQVARKRYFNMMEDMKVLVVAALSNPDELTVMHAASAGSQKEYGFDQVVRFHPGLGQDKVFDSTKALLQSAVNGYNVCVMAYGQVGLDRLRSLFPILHVDRWEWTRSPGFPKLAMWTVDVDQKPASGPDPHSTLRAKNRWIILALAHSLPPCRHTVTMLELYRDQLVDLLVASPTGAKMEIKKEGRTTGIW
eukprot:gene9529-12468_t